MVNKIHMWYKKGEITSRRQSLISKLDKIFSLYIRLRDSDPNGYFYCISCGQMKSWYDADCGHYFSRARMNTRFDERNCHAECKRCNRFLSDHLDGYKRNLVRKIGEEEYEKLRIRANITRRWAEYELEELVKYYRAKAKELVKEKNFSVKV